MTKDFAEVQVRVSGTKDQTVTMLIDKEDLPLLEGLRLATRNGRYVAVTNSRVACKHYGNLRGKVDIHRILMGCKYGDGKIIDHINGNGLDNRRANLRFVDQRGNHRNSVRRSDGLSKYKGVSLKNRRKRQNRTWYVMVELDSEEDCARAYDMITREFRPGDPVNFPREGERRAWVARRVKGK